MGKKRTNLEFISLLKKIQPNLIILSEYKKASTRIIVKDLLGIKYSSLAYSLLRGIVPTIVCAIDKTKAFKIILKSIQPNLIVLGKYKGSITKILIKDENNIKYNCFTHSLILGVVPLIISAVDKNKCFIYKARLMHGDKYDYSKVKYIEALSVVEIICKKHGLFMQRPADHLSGHNCPFCNKRQKRNTLSFINAAKIKHNNLYKYDKVVYVKSLSKVLITCQIHGDFYQLPTHHLQGGGCRTCTPRGYTKTSWIKFCNNKKTADPKVYIIRCFNNTEEFIKIGMTSDFVSQRFRSPTLMPYEYEILKEIKGSPSFVFDKEKELHKLFYKYKYNPLISFGGKTECFDIKSLYLLSRISLELIN
jgi:hypothetical protein